MTLFDLGGEPCLCDECVRLDRDEGIEPTDFAARRQLRLPIAPLPHLAGDPAGLTETEVP